MQSSNLPSDTGSDEDRRHQCWKDVEAETGFSTYKSFLEALKGTGPQFKGLLEILGEPYNRHDFGDVFVLDILDDKSTLISWRVQSEKGPSPRLPRDLQASEVSTQLLQHLRSPPENVQARIVWWSISRDFFPHPSMIETLGPGLKICPSFFETLLSIMRLEIRLNEQGCVKVGNSVAAVTRNYRLEGGAPPIFLVAGKSDMESDCSHPSDIWTRPPTPHHKVVENVLSWEIGGSMLPCRSAIDKLLQSNLESVSSNQYLNLVQTFVQDNNGIDAEGDALLLMGMLLLLHLEILYLRNRSEILKVQLPSVQNRIEHPTTYPPEDTQKRFQSMDKQRFRLRRRLEGLEESRIRVPKCIRSQNAEKLLKGDTWLNQDRDITEAAVAARNRDADARDFMQLPIGNLSILESRKSIQLSNKQMDEAKRGNNYDLCFCEITR